MRVPGGGRGRRQASEPHRTRAIRAGPKLTAPLSAVAADARRSGLTVGARDLVPDTSQWLCATSAGRGGCSRCGLELTGCWLFAASIPC